MNRRRRSLHWRQHVENGVRQSGIEAYGIGDRWGETSQFMIARIANFVYS
jgi:hypothetical protein